MANKVVRIRVVPKERIKVDELVRILLEVARSVDLTAIQPGRTERKDD